MMNNKDNVVTVKDDSVFTQIPLPQKKKAKLAVVIHTSIGKVEILNGADLELIETIVRNL